MTINILIVKVREYQSEIMILQKMIELGESEKIVCEYRDVLLER